MNAESRNPTSSLMLVIRGIGLGFSVLVLLVGVIIL
jgi:hypothetical protein